jgi:hypothetical protein
VLCHMHLLEASLYALRQNAGTDKRARPAQENPRGHATGQADRRSDHTQPIHRYTRHNRSGRDRGGAPRRARVRRPAGKRYFYYPSTDTQQTHTHTHVHTQYGTKVPHAAHDKSGHLPPRSLPQGAVRRWSHSRIHSDCRDPRRQLQGDRLARALYHTDDLVDWIRGWDRRAVHRHHALANLHARQLRGTGVSIHDLRPAIKGRSKGEADRHTNADAARDRGPVCGHRDRELRAVRWDLDDDLTARGSVDEHLLPAAHAGGYLHEDRLNGASCRHRNGGA